MPSRNSSEVLLCIDIGNTNVTIGAFRRENLLDSWRLSTDRHRMADEYRAILGSLITPAVGPLESVAAVSIAGVVPPVVNAFREMLAKLHLPVLHLTPETDLGIEVRYAPPSAVGVDRLINALAVESEYGYPAVVVDLGTATTLDVLDSGGAYVGGAIAPGIETSLEGLFAQAFQLPRLQLEPPSRAIGSSTVESIRSGTLFGYAGLVDALIDRIRLELDAEPVVVGTGGLAPLVAPHTKHVRIVDGLLTLKGLRLAYERLGPSTASSVRPQTEG